MISVIWALELIHCYSRKEEEKKYLQNSIGNMSTLNSPEEVFAEKLINLNPWAEKVRFTRTGGEANAVA